ncbi:MAG: 50S ribosomal protein L6 [Candidatus Sungiibacteriota bacterium]|uniref:Large ribosomal subunit protein uL6 n=1 Tax=Candidatus Sungiibacteriota bacterium TaxID=2750080 RepID=A0A7T5RJ05_9BACT|nr:MAG: 50S ribosomal protein L6 [Candidatus Sungbacteria bacterium]
MSRIGKKPIPVPVGVAVSLDGSNLVVKGPKGELTRLLHPDIAIEIKEGEISVTTRRQTKKTPALWGLFRSLIANMIVGVTAGYEKKLEFEGVGYRANLEGDTLIMQLGFSHPARLEAPSGIKFSVEKNSITILGIDKELVGETAARLRSLKPVEPYKGKGIRYKGEIVRRKAGKKAVAAA